MLAFPIMIWVFSGSLLALGLLGYTFYLDIKSIRLSIKHYFFRSVGKIVLLITIIVSIPVLYTGTDPRSITALMLAIVLGVITDFWLTRFYTRKKIAELALDSRLGKGEITKEEYLEKKKTLLSGYT